MIFLVVLGFLFGIRRVRGAGRFHTFRSEDGVGWAKRVWPSKTCTHTEFGPNTTTGQSSS